MGVFLLYSIVIKYQPALYNVFEVEIEKHILYELRLEAYKNTQRVICSYVIWAMIIYKKCSVTQALFRIEMMN